LTRLSASQRLIASTPAPVINIQLPFTPAQHLRSGQYPEDVGAGLAHVEQCVEAHVLVQEVGPIDRRKILHLEDDVDVHFDNGALQLASAVAIGQRTLFPQGDEPTVAVAQMGRLQESAHGKRHVHADVDHVGTRAHGFP
jgi:hypothetical protein